MSNFIHSAWNLGSVPVALEACIHWGWWSVSTPVRVTAIMTAGPWYFSSPTFVGFRLLVSIHGWTAILALICVLQYAETQEDCESVSVLICNVLAEAGFKAAISTDRVQMIKKMKPPRTVQQLQSFLGLVNLDTQLCHSWQAPTGPDGSQNYAKHGYWLGRWGG